MSNTERDMLETELLEYGYDVNEAEMILLKLAKVKANKHYTFEEISSNLHSWLYHYKQERFSKKEIIKMTTAVPSLLLPVTDNPYLKVKQVFNQYKYTDFEFQRAISLNNQWLEKDLSDVQQRLLMFQKMKIRKAPMMCVKSITFPLDRVYARALFLNKEKQIRSSDVLYKRLFLREDRFQQLYHVDSKELVQRYNAGETVRKVERFVEQKNQKEVIEEVRKTPLGSRLLTYGYSLRQIESIMAYYHRLSPQHMDYLLTNMTDHLDFLEQFGLSKNHIAELTAQVPSLLYQVDPVVEIGTVFQKFGYTKKQFLKQFQCPSVSKLLRSSDRLAQRLFLFDYLNLDRDIVMNYDISYFSMATVYARYQYFGKAIMDFNRPEEMAYLFQKGKELASLGSVSNEMLKQQYPLPAVFYQLSLRDYTMKKNLGLIAKTVGSSIECKKSKKVDLSDPAILSKYNILRRYYTKPQIEELFQKNREALRTSDEKLETCLSFFEKNDLLNLPFQTCCAFRQSFDRTSNRYRYLKSTGALDRFNDLSSLFDSSAKFTEKYGVRDEELQKKYSPTIVSQAWDLSHFQPLYCSDYEEKQLIFERHQYNREELQELYSPDSMLYKMKPEELERYFTLLNCLQVQNSEMPLSLYLNQELEKTYSRYLYLRKEKDVELNRKTLYQIFVGEDLFESMYGVTDRVIQEKYSVDQFFRKLNERKRNVKNAPAGKVLRFVKRIS